jgi:hypothetical protein
VDRAAPTAVKAASTTTAVGAAATAVEAASTTTVTAVLGKNRLGCANQGKGSKSCESNFEQGGFPHLSSLHGQAAGCPGGQTASTD